MRVNPNPNAAMGLTSAAVAPAQSCQKPTAPTGAVACLRAHWPEYAIEASLLGAFMVSACLFGTLYGHPASAVRKSISSDFVLRVLMGLSMGLTAIAIIYSPLGKQSGAHINPATTLTFLSLGKVKRWDAIFYICAQFIGGVLGVMLSAALLGTAIAEPHVRYVVTIPGARGYAVAFVAEVTITFLLMWVVLTFTNQAKLAMCTGLAVGALVAAYITLEAPYSGMSMNPARTLGSAVPARVFEGLWIYFTAPVLGMLAAAKFYTWKKGRAAVGCAKLHHNNEKRCIFCGANGGFES